MSVQQLHCKPQVPFVAHAAYVLSITDILQCYHFADHIAACKLQRDATGNKAMTELPKSDIMGLLKDASSLIKVRDNASSLSNAQRVPDAFHVVSLQNVILPCKIS